MDITEHLEGIDVKPWMKSTFLRFAGPAMVVIALGVIWFLAIVTQQIASGSSVLSLTTHWTGTLVIGKTEAMDHMPLREPFAKAVAEVEIGLRSDGVVVWRAASRTK